MKNSKKAVEKKSAPTLPWGKLAALPRRVLVFGGAAVFLVILIILFLFSGSPEKAAPPATSPQAVDSAPGPGGENFLERPPGQLRPQPPQKVMIPEEEYRPTVQSIRLRPPQPTRMDTLNADILTTPDTNHRNITYSYVWKVNNRIIEGATGDTLPLATFKKRDLVTVTVTPYDGDKAGFPVESPVAIIYGAPPSLDLQTPLKTIKVGEPLALQLVSLHPDSESITFSLEAPLVPGMSIDSHTGKITWSIPPNHKGTVRFGAAVEDTDKTKVTKTFEITIE
jgi:hypothetical protein